MQSINMAQKTRLNIQISLELKQRLVQLSNLQGKKISMLVRESIEEKLYRIEKEIVEEKMKRAYQDLAQENLETLDDFKFVDAEQV